MPARCRPICARTCAIRKRLIRVQGEVYGLYHTQSAKVFFQREDVWNVAQQVGSDEQNRKQVQPIDPYFVLMQLPGEQNS